MNKKIIVGLIICLFSIGAFNHNAVADDMSFSDWKALEAQEETEYRKDDPQSEPVKTKEDPVRGELAPKKKAKRKPTSFGKIRDALENKKISEQDAMILQIIAGFTPEELPEEYRSGETSTRSSLQEAVKWLDKNYPNLDPETQKALKPYYVLPDHPEHYLNIEKPAEKLKKILLNFLIESLFVSEAVAAAPVWNKLEASVGAAKADIFYKSADLAQAKHVKASFEKSTPKFEKLLKVHVPKTVFYILPISDMGIQSTRIIGGVECSYIRIKKGLNEKQTLSTTAHEAFHSHQDWMNLDYSGERRWIMEATATWAEDHAYPGKNVEHDYLEHFFKNLGKDLVYFGDDREYATYVWPWFLTQYYKNPALIRTILLKSRGADARKAATTGFIKKYFDIIFAEYALWNVNQFTAIYYKDTETIYEDAFMSDTYRSRTFRDENAKETFPIMTEPLSSQYLGFKFVGSKKIIIDMKKIAPDNIRRRVLVKKDGRWQKKPQDWSYVKRKVFCPERDGEKIEGLVMIISNANLHSDYYDDLDVKVYDDCEPGWHGTTTITWDAEFTENIVTVGGSKGTQRRVRKGRYVMRDKLNMHEPEEEDDGYHTASISSTDIEYESYYLMTQNLPENCGLIQKVFERTESGTLALDYSEDESKPNRLFYDAERPNEGVNLYFELKVDHNWIRERETATYKYSQGCSRQLVPEKDRTSITEKFDNQLVFYPVEGIQAEIPFEKTFKGTHKYSTTKKGMPYEVTVEYDYEFE